MKTFTWCDIYV